MSPQEIDRRIAELEHAISQAWWALQTLASHGVCNWYNDFESCDCGLEFTLALLKQVHPEGCKP